MGKQGPCCHCGVTSTPLWRNGPPEKPVLCNACGSRWRTKGTLANYTPLHARLVPDECEDHRITRVKTISLKRRDEKLNKRKLNDSATDGDYTPDYSQGFQKNLDEDASNRSSSGSAISNSESCAQFGSADASDLTGPAQSIVWDALVPSRKRTCFTRPKQSSVEKLTKELHTILNEQASHFSGSTEEDLLFGSEAPMGSVEFGHGSVLIRHPHLAREDESEASSLSVDNKLHRADDGYTTPASLVSFNDSKSVYNSCSRIEKVKRLNGQIVKLELAKREKSNHEKLQILWNQDSPLHQIDLTEIANSDVFWGNLSADEQQDLLKYLPSVDTSTLSDGLKSMFDSPYFMENLSSFQKLLAEGVLDSSLPGVKTEDSKVVKGLALSNLAKSKWVELYNVMMKDKAATKSTGERVSLSGSKSSSSGNVGTAKNFHDSKIHVCPEAKTTLKIPQKVLVKSGHKGKETVQNESSCFTPTSKNIFAFQTDGNCLMLDSFHFEDESSDQDLLLDIPSNGSFPQAELLHPASSFAS